MIAFTLGRSRSSLMRAHQRGSSVVRRPWSASAFARAHDINVPGILLVGPEFDSSPLMQVDQLDKAVSENQVGSVLLKLVDEAIQSFRRCFCPE